MKIINYKKNNKTVFKLGFIIIFLLSSSYFINNIEFEKDIIKEGIKEKEIVLSHKKTGDKITFYKLIDSIISKDGYKVMMSVYDDGAYKIDPKIISKLSSLGGEKINNLELRDSYVAVVEDGKYVLEEHSKTETLKVFYDDFVLWSWGLNTSPRLTGGVRYVGPSGEDKDIKMIAPRTGRGFNIIIINKKTKEVNSYVFDTFKYPDPESERIECYGIPLFDELLISISDKDYAKMKELRNETLKRGLNLNADKFNFNSIITYKDKEYNSEIKLKGNASDHISDPFKWSIKISLKKGFINGTNQFSVQHPRSRNYYSEWVFHKFLKSNKIVAPNYGFMKVKLNVGGRKYINMGVMAFEESMTKYLLSNNNMKPGVILKFDSQLGLENLSGGKADGSGVGRTRNSNNLPISSFYTSEIFSDENLKKQFKTANNIIRRLHDNRLSDIYKSLDINKFVKYSAIVSLLAGHHSLYDLDDLRYYYNPISSMIEPVGWDVCPLNDWALTMPIIMPAIRYRQRSSKYDENVIKHVIKNEYEEFNLEVAKELYLIVHNKELQKELENYFIKETRSSRILSREFPSVIKESYDLYKERLNYLQRIYKTSNALDIYLEGYKNKSLNILFRNITDLPIRLNNISYEGKIIKNWEDEIKLINSKSFEDLLIVLTNHNENIFLNKKTGLLDLKKIEVSYSILGSKRNDKSKLICFKYESKSFLEDDVLRNEYDNNFFPFIKYDNNNVLFIKSLKPIILDKPLIIGKGYNVTIPKGFKLDIREGGKIIFKSLVNFKGTKEEPIVFYSSDKKGQGMAVINAKGKSRLENVIFNNLSNPDHYNWSLTGAVTFYESDVELKNVYFSNNDSEDALNIVRSNFVIDSTYFYNTRSDAFDGDFVKGEIKNSFFDKLGNDAIDVSGSDITMTNVEITNAGDKAISIGEESIAKLFNSRISNSAIAINAKDNSSIYIDSLYVKTTKLVFTAFQKKPEFGPATIKANNIVTDSIGRYHLIENKSTFVLNNKDIKEKVEKVKDQMYGADYGKKSIR